MSSALRSAGITQNVVFSAKDMAILYQSFPKNVEQMGYNIADIQQKADSGQSIEVPLADMHAQLDAETFNVWADYMLFIPTYKNANGNNNADMNTPETEVDLLHQSDGKRNINEEIDIVNNL